MNLFSKNVHFLTAGCVIIALSGCGEKNNPQEIQLLQQRVDSLSVAVQQLQREIVKSNRRNARQSEKAEAKTQMTVCPQCHGTGKNVCGRGHEASWYYTKEKNVVQGKDGWFGWGTGRCVKCKGSGMIAAEGR
jgi:hypothetical protein